MLNKLWLKACKIADDLITTPEDKQILRLKIFVNLIERYIDTLRADLRRKHKAELDISRVKYKTRKFIKKLVS